MKYKQYVVLYSGDKVYLKTKQTIEKPKVIEDSFNDNLKLYLQMLKLDKHTIETASHIELERDL
jgi:hypothetical protein